MTDAAEQWVLGPEPGKAPENKGWALGPAPQASPSAPMTLNADGTPQVPTAGYTPPPEPPYNQSRYRRLVDEAVDEAKTGYGRMTASGASPWERTKGAGQAAMGGFGYVTAPVTELGDTLGYDPVNAVISQMLGKKAGDIAGKTASLGVQMLTPGGIKKGVEALPGMLEAAPGVINEAATAVGRVGRGAVDAVDDMVKAGLERRQTAKAAEAANAPPSREVLRAAGGGEYQAAKELGGEIKPEGFQTLVNDLRPTLDKTMDIDPEMLNAPDSLYKNTARMLRFLDTRSQNLSSFSKLISTQQQVREYVKDAKAVADAGGSGADYAAAQSVSKRLDDFIANLKPEDMMPGSDINAANTALNAGKEMWSRNGKLGALEEIKRAARDLKQPEKIQSAAEKIVGDSDAFGRFTPHEQDLLKQIAQTGNKSFTDDLTAAALGGAAGGGAFGMPGGAIGAASGLVLNKAGQATYRAVQGRKINNLLDELLTSVAQGGAKQAEIKANQGPGFWSQVNDVLRPQPENSANRRFTTSNNAGAPTPTPAAATNSPTPRPVAETPLARPAAAATTPEQLNAMAARLGAPGAPITAEQAALAQRLAAGQGQVQTIEDLRTQRRLAEIMRILGIQ